MTDIITDYEFINITLNEGENIIFNIKFTIDEIRYNFYVKIGKYDYGDYDEKSYSQLSNISIDACCYGNDLYATSSKYVYESIIYEKMTEIEQNDPILKNKIVKLNNRGIVTIDNTNNISISFNIKNKLKILTIGFGNILSSLNKKITNKNKMKYSIIEEYNSTKQINTENSNYNKNASKLNNKIINKNEQIHKYFSNNITTGRYSNIYEFLNYEPFKEKQKLNLKKLYYYITETDDEYSTLDEHLKRNSNNSNNLNNSSNKEKFYNLAKDIISDLKYLYEVYGFIHWDLHSKNILIHNTTTKYKLFDFDTSQLKYNGKKYMSCNYADINKENPTIHIRNNKLNVVYNVDIFNIIDYYSLFFQASDYNKLFLSKCIDIDTIKTIFRQIDKYFVNLIHINDSTILASNVPKPLFSSKPTNLDKVTVTDILFLKRGDTITYRVIASLILKMYFSGDINNLFDISFNRSENTNTELLHIKKLENDKKLCKNKFKNK